MSAPTKTWSADGLVKAIERRHADDLVIPECKTGPSQSSTHRRFDAWVLVRTWTPITTIGYEVKVSRSDWRRDEKLADYQGLCHLLYVVAPKGVVPVEEVPDGVGLLEAVGDGARLVTRRKASRREIELPAKLLVYILMARVVPSRDREMRTYEEMGREARRAELKRWAESKQERRGMSYLVSQRIREQFEAQEEALREAQATAKRLETVRQRIVELGFDPDTRASEWAVSGRLGEMVGVVGDRIPALLRRSISELEHVCDQLDAIRRKAKETPDGPRDPLQPATGGPGVGDEQLCE